MERIQLKNLKVLVLILAIGINQKAWSQKKLIDSAELIGSARFQMITNVIICPNGRFTAFVSPNSPAGNESLYLINNYNRVTFRKANATFLGFSADSKLAVVSCKDTLILVTLPDFKISSKTLCKALICPSVPILNWIGIKMSTGDLKVLDLIRNRELVIKEVQDATIGKSGKLLLITLQFQHHLSEIKVVNPLTFNVASIFKNTSNPRLQLAGYDFDDVHSQICFATQSEKNTSLTVNYWYRNLNSQESRLLLSDESSSNQQHISTDVTFNSTGKYILYNKIDPADVYTADLNKPHVNIWSYRDSVLQSFQVFNLSRSGPRKHLTAIDVSTGRSTQLQNGDESIIYPTGYKDCLIQETIENSQPEKRYHYSLVYLKSGKRQEFYVSTQILINFSFSPTGKYLVYFDNLKDNFVIYEPERRKLKELAIKDRTFKHNGYTSASESIPVTENIIWLGNSDSFLISDTYDIWRIDALGESEPLCITQNYGRKNSIKLRLLELHRNGHALLVGFGDSTKYNGFFELLMNKAYRVDKLSYGPYCYYHDPSTIAINSHEFNMVMKPIKARDAAVWVVRRESSTESPNLYLTRDFRAFTPLTDFKPQKNVNWLTTELLTWQPPKGPRLQGVLYKPENFDPNKKYPVIINFYEQLSHRMYEFPEPELSRDNLNIPLFVSNGYLVLTADVHFENSKNSNTTVGEWALNAIEAATKYISNLPYVDKEHIGIQGHSFGGMEAAFLATHSKMFAAAMEACGATEPISHYLSILNAVGAVGEMEYYADPRGIEKGHYMYGASLWERPDLYLRNSAVLSADKIVAPLLIMHNRYDNSLNWHQAISLYLSMKRLQKRCWMLEYDGEGHVILDDKNALDYTMRMKQFFDHYLKGVPAPVWMTKGIPAKLKGIETGYELDPGVEP